ncbi:MAG TPA: SHOCT domain-containing protein [Bacteroidia bacterium]|jgi:hypothetical protein|nr:SHOCT domain-containing protein [Bacteroidia bacterium]
MKIIGWILLGVGIIFGIYALSMDVSVSIGGGDRVNNIGLMNDRQNYLIVSAVMCIIGVVILISSKSKQQITEAVQQAQSNLSNRDKLKNLLTKFEMGRRDSLPAKTIETMENIKARRIKLGFTFKNDSDAAYIHWYRNAVTSSSIIKFLDIVEQEQNEKKATTTNQNTGVAEELIKLKGLVDRGILTQAEFEEQKKKLLS